MLFPKTVLLALLPFFIQANAHPSGNTHLVRANDAVNKAPTGAAAPVVKRQDDNDGSGGDDNQSGSDSGEARLYDQCGGIEFNGPTSCAEGSTCRYQNDYYSQCLSYTKMRRQDDGGDGGSDVGVEVDDGSQVDDGSDTDVVTVEVYQGSQSGAAKHYDQCGGLQYTGPTQCAQGYSCRYSNDWYSQCL